MMNTFMRNIIKQHLFLSIFSVLMLALLFTGCSPAGGDEPAADDASSGSAEEPGTADTAPEPDAGVDLTGPIWLLQQMGDQTPADDARPTLEFTDGQAAGTTGCNNYFGQIELEGDSISFGPLGMTEMWCEGGMEQEQAFINMLQAVHSFTLSENELVLHSDEGDLLFTVAADRPLEGTNWVLEAIAEENAIVSTWVDADINALFVDGQLSGSSGCNSYSGEYTLTEEGLELGAIVSTLMACADEDRSEREQQFLTALNAAAGYEIERDTLRLLDADGNLLMSFYAVDETAVGQPGDSETETSSTVEEEAPPAVETVTLFVGPERVSCVGVAPQECYQVKRSADAEWELFYDEIAGLEWEAGYEYELLVQVTTNPNPPADASALEYELLEVVSRTAVD